MAISKYKEVQGASADLSPNPVAAPDATLVLPDLRSRTALSAASLAAAMAASLSFCTTSPATRQLTERISNGGQGQGAARVPPPATSADSSGSSNVDGALCKVWTFEIRLDKSLLVRTEGKRGATSTHVPIKGKVKIHQMK